MFNRVKLLRFASPLITLLLLAVLAFQVARLVWHLTTPRVTIQASVIQPTPSMAWLPSLILAPPIHRASPVVANVLHSSAHTAATLPSAPDHWTLRGVYAEAGDSVAIIKTPAKSYVVEVGDAIENGYHVRHIAPNHVTLADAHGNDSTLSLVNNHLQGLVANTIGGESLALLTTTHRNGAGNSAILSPFDSLSKQSKIKWLSHVDMKPYHADGQHGIELSAASLEGFNQLRHFGLRQGDILLLIDGQPPSPAVWSAVVKKWQQSKEIRAKIMRHSKIETINIKKTP